MQFFQFRFEVDAEIAAESLEEAWEIVKLRMADRFYGPTQEDIEFLRETAEPEASRE